MSGFEFTIDTTRTELQQHFFNMFRFDSREELFTAISDMEVGLDSIARSSDARTSVYSGWVYWFLFLKGYLRFVETGRLEDGNIYLDYLVRYYGPRDHDPGISMELCVPELARERVAMRFASMKQAASEAADPGTWETQAVLVIVREPPPTYPLDVYALDALQPFPALLVDGWHRLFAARLWGIPSLPGLLVREAELDEAAPKGALAGSG
jgi:hypothetical protein